MNTANAILQLRHWKGLSQEAFASRVGVTRQAVSRWESEETVPTSDNLRKIAETFEVSTDYLLGLPSAFCQSCGMIFSSDQQRGSEKDGSPSADYCAWCYKDGAFTAELSMDEMIDSNLKSLKEYNRERGQEFSFEGAKAALKEQLPQLKRWKEKHKDP